MVGRSRNSASDNCCAINRLICIQWHSANQFLASRNTCGTFKQTGLRCSSSQFLSLRCRLGRCGSPCETGPAAVDLAVLDHADNTRVDRAPRYRCPLHRYRPLGSCPRAAGWSAATSCVGPLRRNPACVFMSAVRGKPDMARTALNRRE